MDDKYDLEDGLDNKMDWDTDEGREVLGLYAVGNAALDSIDPDWKFQESTGMSLEDATEMTAAEGTSPMGDDASFGAGQTVNNETEAARALLQQSQERYKANTDAFQEKTHTLNQKVFRY